MTITSIKLDKNVYLDTIK